MRVEIYYSKASKKFLEANKGLLTRKDVEEKISGAIKKISKIENNQIDVKMLKGNFKDYYRVRIGKKLELFLK